ALRRPEHSPLDLAPVRCQPRPVNRRYLVAIDGPHGCQHGWNSDSFAPELVPPRAGRVKPESCACDTVGQEEAAAFEVALHDVSARVAPIRPQRGRVGDAVAVVEMPRPRQPTPRPTRGETLAAKLRSTFRRLRPRATHRARPHPRRALWRCHHNDPG